MPTFRARADELLTRSPLLAPFALERLSVPPGIVTGLLRIAPLAPLSDRTPALTVVAPVMVLLPVRVHGPTPFLTSETAPEPLLAMLAASVEVLPE